ncbi:MAG: cation acetate symporter [Actinobacteria bacterium]|nr:MAG: cation acetate symporter [Actinomycetota bacterium]
MSNVAVIPLMFVIGIVVATIGLGIWATRLSRTTSDFYVAGRGVNAFWNSSAISGEYLSAASFMGIAGMVMKFGYDVLWYAVGYAAGYVFLLLFIAGPLRRFGAYTIPDFAEGRFDSKNMRKVAVTLALCISFFYMMPQMKGAGITLAQLLGSPYWVGVVVVGAVITMNVILGGMKGITLVQAFQYWVKMFAISIPIFILFTMFGGYGANVTAGGNMLRLDADKKVIENPDNAKLDITKDTVVKYAALSDLKFVGKEGTIVPTADAHVKVTNYGPAGEVIGKEKVTLPAGQKYTWVKTDANAGQKITFTEKTEVTLVAPMKIPNVATGNKWLAPFGPFTSKYVNPLDPVSVEWVPLLYTYSLIIALLCGTAGLPHILVRFYTNPDGRSAKRTTLLVIGMLSLFYIFPAMWGALGRVNIPMLYANGATDLVTIKLPTMFGNATVGQILSGITSAGAFAAFMTTFSGLLVSVSGGMAHDIYGRMLRPQASPESRLKAFKIAAAIGGTVAIALGLLVETFDINMLVGWAFAIGASTYFPLLLLGSWWSRLTKAGAVVGMVGGGTAAIASVVFTMLVDKGLATAPASGFVNTLLAQPAIWTVPLALGLMAVVSLATPSMIPGDIRMKMLKLHAPEQLGLKADYIKD